MNVVEVKNMLKKSETEVVVEDNDQEIIRVVNHVMSSDVKSDIFDSIIKYLRNFGDPNFTQIVSVKPIEGADVYHYHRVNLENSLMPNSVTTVHHDLDDNDHFFKSKNFIEHYRECAGIICLNKTQIQRLEGFGIPSEKLVHIPHGFNSKVLAPKKTQVESRLNQKINIGMISRRYRRRVKGDAYLFELAKRLSPSDFEFTLVGRDRTLTAVELRRLGFECSAYDKFPYKMIQSFYEEIDILLMCSLFEGGPANIPEGIATQTPIFSSKIAMANDMISHGHNGIFLTMNPESDGAMLQTYALNEKKLLIQLAKKTKKYKSTAINWARVAALHTDFYGKLCDQVNTKKTEVSENGK